MSFTVYLMKAENLCYLHFEMVLFEITKSKVKHLKKMHRPKRLAKALACMFPCNLINGYICLRVQIGCWIFA